MDKIVKRTTETNLIFFLKDFLSKVFNFPGCDNDQLEERYGPEWLWWMVDNFIRSEELKLMFLSTNSLEERLNLIQRQLCQN